MIASSLPSGTLAYINPHLPPTYFFSSILFLHQASAFEDDEDALYENSYIILHWRFSRHSSKVFLLHTYTLEDIFVLSPTKPPTVVTPEQELVALTFDLPYFVADLYDPSRASAGDQKL